MGPCLLLLQECAVLAWVCSKSSFTVLVAEGDWQTCTSPAARMFPEATLCLQGRGVIDELVKSLSHTGQHLTAGKHQAGPFVQR